MANLELDLSEFGEFESNPPGVYHVKVTGVTEKETGESSKHPGNPFWNVEMTIQSGKYEGRKEWTNVMLPPYQPIELGRMLKVCPSFAGNQKAKVSEDGSDLLDEEFIIKIGRQKGSDEYNEVKKYYPLEGNEHLLDDDDDDLAP